jgi:hypothetical protein
VLLLAVGATAGAFALLRDDGTAVDPTPTPTPTASVQPSGTLVPSSEPSPSAANQTPFPETPRPDPTPLPDDTFIGYEVTVLEGENTIFEVDDQGNVVDSRTAQFSRFSKAAVDRIEAPNGLLHWRTSDGFFTGLSYIRGQSGPFLIREVYQGSDGQLRYLILPEDET